MIFVFLFWGGRVGPVFVLFCYSDIDIGTELVCIPQSNTAGGVCVCWGGRQTATKKIKREKNDEENAFELLSNSKDKLA